MNTSSLKTFAQDARNKLRVQVAARLNYWLGAEGGTAPDTAAHRQFAPQIMELAEALKKEGRDGLVERISYTWFNRLVALRFMDANDFHPFGIRVVTPASENEILPALLQQARSGALNPEIRAKLANPQSFDDILAGRIPVAHQETELFGMLLLAACNYYHAVMPFLFEKLGDATQLLLPEDLLSEQSILTDIRENLTAEDCAEVEVIGWLYQFYISEKKDEVMGRKKAVPTEDIPAVTQLFTPHWIVRYLVENSLGRLWLLNRPHSRLREHMPYYIEEVPSDQSSVIRKENDAPTDLFSSTDHCSLATDHSFLKITRPEDIKLVDPASGSGHMLTYAFDLLYRIYEEEGYDAPEIPSLILKHNLHGLEICDRAAALAAFALCMKARAKDRRFFKRLTEGTDQAPRPHIIELRDVRFAENELHEYSSALRLSNIFQHPTLRLLHQFEEAKNFGSLIQPCFEEPAIAELRRILAEKDLGDHLFLHETHAKILRVLDQAEALTQRYHVVVANPPYMGAGQMNAELKAFVSDQWEDGKSDSYAAFILRNLALSLDGGLIGMITIPNWMSLTGFRKLRDSLLRTTHFRTFLQCGRGVWGSDFGSCAFVAVKGEASNMKGIFRRLSKRPGEVQTNEEIAANFFDQTNYPNFLASSSVFRRIPGIPIVFWLSERALTCFTAQSSLASTARLREGINTGDNERFLRLWHEVDLRKTSDSTPPGGKVERKWVPHKKGGNFRKWFGNCEFVLNWQHDGTEIHAFHDLPLTCNGAPMRGKAHFFKPSLAWSRISIGRFSARCYPEGFSYDSTAPSVFDFGESENFLLGFLNCELVGYLLAALSPTVDFRITNIGNLPLLHLTNTPERARIERIVGECVSVARADWDNFETSWDFRDQPLLRPELKGSTLESSWRNWEAQSTAAISRMQELETENNRLFIAAYGLETELEPTVPEAQITLARPDARRDIAAFISYAVGCMMGRYSPNRPGLILADAGATIENYTSKVSMPTFTPDEDGILPVLDDEWFTDDIVGRFREFLRVTFGEESFAANLRFIEESLGKPEAKTGKIKPTEIRSYFAGEFYKNHISSERAYGYKKRPIYWMVSSPNGSFQALIYLHRYTRDTMNHLLDRYVRPFLDKLEQRQQACTVISTDDSAKPAARTAAQKELIKLGKMLKEIREWERDTLLPIAQKRIELDLDDGVKVNYLKFKGVLVPIPGLEKKED